MAELGKFFVTIGSRFDEKGMKKARESVNAIGKRFLLFGAGATAALIAVTNKASKLEETTAKFNTVFRGVEDTARGFSDELVRSYGMSLEQSRRFLSSIQDLLVPMGMQRDLAADLSGEIVKLSADLGSFNNMPTEQVMMDIQSALVGNFETMKKYGVVLNATAVEQEIMNQGWVKAKEDITPAMKAQAAYNLIVAGSTDAIGDFNRTSASYANQVKIMTARISDLITKLGDKFLPMMTETVGIITRDILPAIDEWITESENIDSISGILIGTLGNIAKTILGVVATIDLIITAYKTLAKATKATYGALELSARNILAKVRGEHQETTDENVDNIEEMKGSWDSFIDKIQEYGDMFKKIDNKTEFIRKKTEKAKTDAAKKGMEDRKKLLEDEGKAEKKTSEEIRKMWEDRFQVASDITGQLTETLTSFQDFKNVQIENDMNKTIDAENQKYETRLAWIHANITDEEEKAKAIEELEEGHNAAINNIKEKARNEERKARKALKPFLIGEAIANTALGATKALSQWGFPLGTIMAGLVTAAGLFQVAKIKAQKFAEGGLVTGPTLGILGEGGRDEVALPLEHPNTIKALSGALSAAMVGGVGGNIYITVPAVSTRQEAKRMGGIIGKEFVRKVQKTRRI